MDVEFKNITYTIPRRIWESKGPAKVILKSLSGRFKAGELSAILGPSGAGKSSLLNALSGYRSTGVDGSLCTNGSVRDERVFRKCSCYITQDDLLQPLMTLRELMMFAARLKMPSNTTYKQRYTTVTEIISKLGLSQSEDTFTELLSGGQKKRLSVGLELVNNPPVFFLDEPTSGLDNVSTKHCLKMLRSLALQGRTIVCTIHQPSASMFELFDHVYVVSQGVCVYQGPTFGLIPFMASVGLHCPLSYNPADYVIEMTDSQEVHNVKIMSTAIQNGQIVWKPTSADIILTDSRNSVQGTNCDYGKLQQASSLSLDIDSAEMRSMDFPSSCWVQFITLLGRMFLQIRRNKTALWIQLLHHSLCSALIGLVFYNSADDGLGWFNHLKCTIGIVVFHAYTWCMVPVLTYPNEVKLLKREYFNRWYGFKPYYLALTISTLPSKIVFSLIFLTGVYTAWGLPYDYDRFIFFCIIGIVTSLVSEGLGYAIGSTFSVTNGAAVGPACIAPFLGLAVFGFDFASQIPLATQILMKLSFIRCAVVAMAITVFGLDRKELGCSDQFGYCHFRDPKVLMEMLDLVGKSVWSEIMYLCGILLVFRVLFFALLQRRLKT